MSFLLLFNQAVINTSVSYAQAQDLINRFDVRVLGDLASDTVRKTPSQLIGPPVDSIMQAALDDATGLINAAAQVGERYTQAELSALTGADQAILFRLNCDIAFTYLCQRRGTTPPGYQEAYDRSADLLNRLREGELVFNVPSDVASGTPAMEFPSLVTYATVNLLRDQAWQLFPLREPQNPASS